MIMVGQVGWLINDQWQSTTFYSYGCVNWIQLGILQNDGLLINDKFEWSTVEYPVLHGFNLWTEHAWLWCRFFLFICFPPWLCNFLPLRKFDGNDSAPLFSFDYVLIPFCITHLRGQIGEGISNGLPVRFILKCHYSFKLNIMMNN